MVLEVFKIVLDQVAPEHKAYPTEIPLTGHVVIKTSRVEDYTKVRVSIKGKGEVEWEEAQGVGEERRVEKYDAKEVYIKKEVTLWKKSEDPEGCFTAGDHTFPFEFVIPKGSPSTFKSNIAEIGYKLKAKIEQPGKDDKTKQSIKVVDLVDSDASHLQSVVRREKTKSVGFLCCAAGDVMYSMELNRTGFLVKDGVIQMQFHVENGSSREINMEVKLIQKIRYKADGKLYYQSKNVLEEKSSVISANTTTDWTPSNLKIPDVIVTTKDSKLFEVNYVLSACAEIPYSLDPTVDIPVILGNAAHFRDPQ